MFHLAAATASLGNVANTEVTALTDQILSIRSGRFVPARDLELIAAAGIGDELLRLRLNGPKQRAITPHHFLPVKNAVGWDNNQQICDYRNSPIMLPYNEDVVIEASNSAAGPTQTTALLFLRAMQRSAPVGERTMFRGTSVTASVAFTWTDVTMTWGTTLPGGEFAVVGGAYYGATALAFRVLFEGQTYRPGGIGNITESEAVWMPQLNAGLGLWGTFTNAALPQIQVFNGGAVSAHTIYLDLIKIR